MLQLITGALAPSNSFVSPSKQLRRRQYFSPSQLLLDRIRLYHGRYSTQVFCCSYDNSTVIDVLQNSMQYLQSQNAPEPTLSVCHLLSQALRLPPSGFFHLLQVLDNKNKQLSQRRLTTGESIEFKHMVQRRANHEPIQYILGEWDFYDFRILCRAPILCPRPETEELVDWVRQSVQKGNAKKIKILEVGSGTGAIGLALARLFPDADVVAIDVSLDAVNLSMENAKLLEIPNARYQAICCSAKDFTNQNAKMYKFEFDVVVSNPPYILSSDMLTLTRDVVQYESREALCGGHDGLDVIRDIVDRMPEWTNNAQIGVGDLFMEVDTSHPNILKKWLEDDGSTDKPAFFVESKKDCYGNDRFVHLRTNPQYQR